MFILSGVILLATVKITSKELKHGTASILSHWRWQPEMILEKRERVIWLIFESYVITDENKGVDNLSYNLGWLCVCACVYVCAWGSETEMPTSKSAVLIIWGRIYSHCTWTLKTWGTVNTHILRLTKHNKINIFLEYDLKFSGNTEKQKRWIL